MRGKSYKEDTKDSKDRGSQYKGGKKKREFDKDRKNSANLDRTGRDNDPNFYFTNKELAEQAAQLSFQNMMGAGDIDGYPVASIMRIRLNPCPGVSYAWRDFKGSIAPDKGGICRTLLDDKRGINLMSAKLYTMLSTFTGRTSQYAPQDVAMMLLAISSVAELSEHLRRAFGIALTYNPRNRNLPLGLIRSMGLNTVDLISNLPAYRMRFNVSMTRINQIPLLDNIGFIRKSREIYQRVYMDSLSPMAQIFYYAPSSVWILDESTDSNGSMLVTKLVQGSDSDAGERISTYLDLLDEMITALLESSTLNLIYADLLNMANKIKVPVWQFDYLAENYIVMPEFNRNALLQLHNLRIVGAPVSCGTNTYYRTKTDDWHYDPLSPSATMVGTMTVTSQNNVISDANKNNIVYNPVFRAPTYTKVIVDMDNPAPSIEDRIEALRFSSASSGCKIMLGDVDGTSSTDLVTLFTALPDHYVVDISIMNNIDYTGTVSKTTFAASISKDSMTQLPISYMEKFTSAPLLIRLNTSDDYMHIFSIQGDLDFYTTVDYDYLSRLNELMYTGLFDFRV